MAAAAPPTVCLVMIVKNEQDNMPTCLASTWPVVDRYCIVDTGSQDGTLAAIEAFVAKHPKPGAVHCRPWVDFGRNRSEALALARAEAGPRAWALMMDADDVFHAQEPAALRAALPDPVAGASCIHVAMRMRDMEYRRNLMLSCAFPWEYVGKLHECPQLRVAEGDPPPPPPSLLPSALAWVEARCAGCRSRNPNKYRDDALLLDGESAATGDPRCLFYAAQSWRDAGDAAKALTRYSAVAASAGHWVQERYEATCNIVNLAPADQHGKAAEAAWLSCALVPDRLETAFAFLRRVLGMGAAASPAQTQEAAALAAHVAARQPPQATAPPPGALFAQLSTYQWAFWELAASALACAKPAGAPPVEQAVQWMGRALARCPPEEYARVRMNANVVRGSTTISMPRTALQVVLPAGARTFAVAGKVPAAALGWLRAAGLAARVAAAGKGRGRRTAAAAAADLAVVALPGGSSAAAAAAKWTVVVFPGEVPLELSDHDAGVLARATAVWALDLWHVDVLHFRHGVPLDRAHVLPLAFEGAGADAWTQPWLAAAMRTGRAPDATQPPRPSLLPVVWAAAARFPGGPLAWLDNLKRWTGAGAPWFVME